MNPRWSAAVKGYALLAVAAATPGCDVATLIMYILVRHQEQVWDPSEPRVKRAPGAPKASLRARLGNRKLEFAVAFAVTLARTVLSWLIGYGWADVAMIAVVGTVIAPGSGGWAREQLLGACRRRRWEHSLSSVLPATVPTIMNHGTGRTGEWVDVRVAPGATVTDLVKRAEAIAAFHAVPEVRVQPDPGNAGAARIVALHTDPLAGPAIPWPPPPGPVSLWQPVPVGVDETGNWVHLTLFKHNLLVGDEPGAGKSVAVHQLVAAAALDPTAQLWLCDPKLVELACWRGVAARFAGNDIADGTDLLRQAQAAMDARYRDLLDRGLRKVKPGTPLHLVVVDELAHYATHPDKKASPRPPSTPTRGVGWLLHEAGLPVRLRAFHLDDATIATLAAHAQQLRSAHREAGHG